MNSRILDFLGGMDVMLDLDVAAPKQALEVMRFSWLSSFRSTRTTIICKSSLSWPNDCRGAPCVPGCGQPRFRPRSNSCLAMRFDKDRARTWRHRDRATTLCADDRVRPPRTWLGRDARRILGDRTFVGWPNAAAPSDGHAGTCGTMARAASCGRETVRPEPNQDWPGFVNAQRVRRDARRCC